MEIGDYVRHIESRKVYQVVRKFGPWPVLQPLDSRIELHIPPDMMQYFEVLSLIERLQ